MSKEFLQKLRMVASEADDLLTSCDASDLLDGLEVARDFMFEAASMIEELESRLAQIERERDALMDYVPHNCYSCKHEETRYKCGRPCNWEWRGVCEANTEEE
jgi:hypothetical protein